MQQKFVFPGDILVTADKDKDCKEGHGTYMDTIIQKNKVSTVVKSSVCGVTEATDKKMTVNVKHWKNRGYVIPKEGDTVLLKVTSIDMTSCKGEIIALCQSGKDLVLNATSIDKNHKMYGMIKKLNVRELDTDSVEIWKCFRPNDIVKAQIISLFHNYYHLTTAKEYLGVVMANSVFGHKMQPISWNSMQCPITKTIESRKVAKI
ncbi:hypothetical protein RFI_04635 [Reticulomyxa filosa]|uniref:Exosome complex component CSL4 C-terminal domain-containing protein n=1 Tax=Reticulomyxa filosa TaxID=46433 RepID=X6P2X1_RETFI|nr:hypothetical protein RFI_04635 [Reticulomyxa filosa]|eukprot:ETO32483.1 hypothetical protein RFI_04635 [Reticulomyxa filosa]